MAYKQVRNFDQSKGGNRKNFCLWNVCQGYQIGNKYASAWIAWQNTKQHTGTPPAGLDVPVFFSYTATIDGVNKNWGHIGVRLADGRFWSDGTVYNSIEAYTSTHAPKYVGWGESVNDVQIIKDGGNDMIPDNAHLNSLFMAYLGRGPTKQDTDGYVGKITYNQMIEILDKHPEHIAFMDRYYAGQKALAGGTTLKPGRYNVI